MNRQAEQIYLCHTCGAWFARDPAAQGRPRCPTCGLQITVYRCTRCGHEWALRRDTPPCTCPGCCSPYWNRRRIRPVKDGAEESDMMKSGSDREAGA